MRPAQIAREIGLFTRINILSPSGFNEARANCAGNWYSTAIYRRRQARFNEARANCAGNSGRLGAGP